MSGKFNFSNRKYVIGAVAVIVTVTYILRLFNLQILSDEYKKNADSNAFRKEIQYPSRGLIQDRKGQLMVFNEPSYNIMVVMQEQLGVDTADFCRTIGITEEEYVKKMQEIKARRNYSRYTPQLFLGQIPAEEFSVFRENELILWIGRYIIIYI